MNANRLTVTLFLILAGCLPAEGATRYVKTPAIGSANCTSWANACTLATALSVATSGDKIWVKAGTYTGPFNLVSGVQMFGGFAGTENSASQSNPSSNATILDGGTSDRAVYSYEDTATTVLRGFTIQNGSDTGDNGGGGLLVENSAALFVQCVFKNNSAAYFGGAVSVRGVSSPNFINCTFKDNGTGSGTSAQPLGGGAAFLYEGTTTFTNCLFYNNKAGEAGVAFPQFGSATFINCTLANNQATVGDGGAILDTQAAMTFRNSILWGNTVPSHRSGAQIKVGVLNVTTITHSDVQGGFAGTGNIDANPQFTNTGSGDFTVPYDSPCVNAGSNSYPPADAGDLDWDANTTETLPTDLGAFDPRVIDFTVDMGAYEAFSSW